jgi:hypothetical protein
LLGVNSCLAVLPEILERLDASVYPWRRLLVTPLFLKTVEIICVPV